MLDLRPAALDDPDAVALNGELQAYYRRIYGGQDGTPLDTAEFDPPRGRFLVGYDDTGRAVACGGWRLLRPAPDDPVLRPGDAEIKRMYVVPDARGRGHASALLAELERGAAAAGGLRVVLETGTEQPEAVTLYPRRGYAVLPTYGRYRDDPRSRCFAKPLTG